jgi:hypothetical protein
MFLPIFSFGRQDRQYYDKMSVKCRTPEIAHVQFQAFLYLFYVVSENFIELKSALSVILFGLPLFFEL